MCGCHFVYFGKRSVKIAVLKATGFFLKVVILCICLVCLFQTPSVDNTASSAPIPSVLASVICIISKKHNWVLDCMLDCNFSCS